MGLPCPKSDCKCPHIECDAGFIEITYVTLEKYRYRNGEEIVAEKKHQGVKFCPQCDAERAHIQESSSNSEELTRRLKERSPIKRAEIYDKQEASKTRIL